MEDRFSKQSGIYKWTFPNGKIYVGKACNFRERYYGYINATRKNKIEIAVIRALKKYGMDNCKFQIIEITDNMPNSEILFRESLWIKSLRSMIHENGYNICTFSNDNTGKKMSKEARLKMSEARKGMKFSDFHRENIRLAQLGKKWGHHTEATKKKMSERAKGRKPSKLAIRNSILARKGKDMSEDQKFKIRLNSPKNIPIIQLDVDENFVRRFFSIGDAKRFLKAGSSSHISNSIKNSKIAYGFRWKYDIKENS